MPSPLPNPSWPDNRRPLLPDPGFKVKLLPYYPGLDNGIKVMPAISELKAPADAQAGKQSRGTNGPAAI